MKRHNGNSDTITLMDIVGAHEMVTEHLMPSEIEDLHDKSNPTQWWLMGFRVLIHRNTEVRLDFGYENSIHHTFGSNVSGVIH